jgi:hypothetical protein
MAFTSTTAKVKHFIVHIISKSIRARAPSFKIQTVHNRQTFPVFLDFRLDSNQFRYMTIDA